MRSDQQSKIYQEIMHVDAVSDAYWRRPNKERTVGG